MRWLPGRLGSRRPHGRRVITPVREGAVSSVWQSSHNSGLIHHMGIMPLAGTTPTKSYTRSSPAWESLNSPIPLPSTHTLRLLGKSDGLMRSSCWLCSTATHLYWWNGFVLDILHFSFPLRITLADSANGDNRHSSGALSAGVFLSVLQLVFCFGELHFVQWPSPVNPASVLPTFKLSSSTG